MQTICEGELAFDLIRSLLGYSFEYKWKYINSGTYRDVFLGEDGKVYKIPVDLEEDSIGENDKEYKNYLRLKTMPSFEHNGNKWVIPETKLFTFPDLGEYQSIDGMVNLSVIVMSYIVGEPFEKCLDNCGAKEVFECNEHLYASAYYELFDVACDNVLILPNGTRVIIDMQC